VSGDLRNTGLMMPPPLSHRRNEKVGKYCGDGLLSYVDDEVRVSRVWEERRGEN